MIHDGQPDMLMPMRVSLRQPVHAPDQTAGDGTGHPMFFSVRRTQRIAYCCRRIVSAM
jgi:hypothetical protein